MTKKQTHEVFGISNTILADSYVDRGELDGVLATLLNRRNHIAIRGPSKCGKSWLRQRVLSSSITVQCRLGFTNIDIYTNALAELGIRLIVEEATKYNFKGVVEGQISAGNDLIGKVTGKSSGEAGYEHSEKTQKIGHTVNDLKFIAELITASGRRLVIEDVHYLASEQREILAYDLKALWDYGCFIVVVGVWGNANMFVHLNPDLSGRVEELTIEWQPDDLRKIIANGCHVLSVRISREIQNNVIKDCFGNAGLLQRLAGR